MKWIAAQPLIGGMALGFEKEFGKPECIITGFAGNDSQYIHYTNVQRNLNVPVVKMNSTYETIDETSELKEIPQDCLWVMVPICSGLSMLNTSTSGDSARGDPDNKQNQNMYNLTTLAMDNNASVIVFENAPALYTDSGYGVRTRLRDIAREHGYSMGLIKTSTVHHGIPQCRERTFAMFYRDSNPPMFEFEHLPIKNYVDYLDEIPDDATYQNESFYPGDLSQNAFVKAAMYVLNIKTFKELLDHLKANNVTDASIFWMCLFAGLDKCIEYFENVEMHEPELNYCKHVKTKMGMGKGWYDAYPRVFFTDTVNAVISKNLAFIHPRDLKCMNIRQLLWLMGMPHDFQYSEGGHWYMLTQNVPVVTANYIARNIKKYFNNELKIADVDYIMQNNINMRNDFNNVKAIEEW